MHLTQVSGSIQLFAHSSIKRGCLKKSLVGREISVLTLNQLYEWRGHLGKNSNSAGSNSCMKEVSDLGFCYLFGNSSFEKSCFPEEIHLQVLEEGRMKNLLSFKSNSVFKSQKYGQPNYIIKAVAYQ